MGAFTSRQNGAVEEAEQRNSTHAYKYPPRSGNFFGSHFIMGGERFDTPQPESYLFGENADLNFLGCRPTAFPYPPPQASEPTKTLKSLVNIRKESVRFVRVSQEKHEISSSNSNIDNIDGHATTNELGGSGDGNGQHAPCLYNIEFTFDSDAKCAITIYYFCTEEVSPSGVTLVPRDGLTSETYHYEKGINQFFSQTGHVFNPQLIPEDDFIYNPTKEQYPVAIHCVVEEGNEDCRQSHTTICVIDHHPETNSYVLRALKQKIFVDGLCYLLQEIYGIENKAVNKSSIDEEIDDHGSECVICMSETRDTLILPCRHLCLCNSCADSLRYQANNCPICRAPFRALLQIRAVQKGVSSHTIHQNTPTSAPGEPAPCDQHIPPGYIPVSLIEALNGPPQFVGRPRTNDSDMIDGVTHTAALAADNHKATSPLKPNQRRSKIKKNASTSTNTSEVGTITGTNNVNSQALSVVEVTNEVNVNNTTSSGAAAGHVGVVNKKSLPTEKLEKQTKSNHSQDKLQIINERHSLKVPKVKRASNTNSANSTSSQNDMEEDDSENEKLSPLLSPNSKQKINISRNKEVVITNGSDNEAEEGLEMKTTISLKKNKRPDLSGSTDNTSCGNIETTAVNADDSDYYTPEDTQNSILSPLCPERERPKSGDKLGSLKGNAGSFKGANSLVKKNLHKKSTSVGNIVGPGSNPGSVGIPNNVVGEMKCNVSSLPDMLDNPISGNAASTRSSSDSYSSSSSTKQLLSSNAATAAANIIVDDKTALHNAVNV
ncbi:E3 ubiquitin-protein ligase MGRN1-like [Rhagoletis pomonella]|uniref:E3 ubiquitin-protein ligase MGRN1-like n=1 Tax=Rhagoletis pomonella TaxID=28610 RepID=UPI00177C74E0|nr:E3 ubiquitin-protein ligase MGRN1-like [Rhagoletis pomonella]